MKKNTYIFALTLIVTIAVTAFADGDQHTGTCFFHSLIGNYCPF